MQRTRLSDMEAYDPREGIWHTLPAMPQPRSSFGLVSLGGKLYAGVYVGGEGWPVGCVGCDQHTWTSNMHIESMHVQSIQLVELVIFTTSIQHTVGGTVGQHDDITAHVTCYCPVACQWLPAPSMAVPRSNMAVAAL